MTISAYFYRLSKSETYLLDLETLSRSVNKDYPNKY